MTLGSLSPSYRWGCTAAGNIAARKDAAEAARVPRLLSAHAAAYRSAE